MRLVVQGLIILIAKNENVGLLRAYTDGRGECLDPSDAQIRGAVHSECFTLLVAGMANSCTTKWIIVAKKFG